MPPHPAFRQKAFDKEIGEAIGTVRQVVEHGVTFLGKKAGVHAPYHGVAQRINY
jgi:hypothetical protein